MVIRMILNRNKVIRTTHWVLHQEDLRDFNIEEHCGGGFTEYLTTTFLCSALDGRNKSEINPSEWMHIVEINPNFILSKHFAGNGLDWFYNKRTRQLIPGDCNRKVGWPGAEVYATSNLKRVPSPIKEDVLSQLQDDEDAY